MTLPSRKAVYPIGVHNRQRVIVGTVTKSASAGLSPTRSASREVNPMSYVNLPKSKGTLQWEKRKIDSLPNSTLKLSKSVKTYKSTRTLNNTNSGPQALDEDVPQEQTFLNSNLSLPWNSLKTLNENKIDANMNPTPLNFIQTMNSIEKPVFRKAQKYLFSKDFDEKTYKYNQCANQPGFYSVTSKDLKPELFTEPDPQALAPFKKHKDLDNERKQKIALTPTEAKIQAEKIEASSPSTESSNPSITEEANSRSLEKVVHSVYLPKTRFGRTIRPITVGLTVPEEGAMVCAPEEQFLTTQMALDKFEGKSYYQTEKREQETRKWSEERVRRLAENNSRIEKYVEKNEEFGGDKKKKGGKKTKGFETYKSTQFGL